MPIPQRGLDYARTANQFVTTFAMIETVQAMDNLDAILAVDGIDAVYIGPADLGLSLGFAPTLLPEPAVQEAIAAIRDKPVQAGKLAGFHCGSPGMVRQMLAEGFNLATLLTDARMFANTVATALAEARDVRPTLAEGQH